MIGMAIFQIKRFDCRLCGNGDDSTGNSDDQSGEQQYEMHGISGHRSRQARHQPGDGPFIDVIAFGQPY